MDIPNEYKCPITQEIMKEPVSDNEGNSYEKISIEKWLSRNNTSPISRRPLYIRDLRPNIALKNLISSFVEKNKKSTEVLTMREARLKRFDKSSQPSNPTLPTDISPPEAQTIREPDPIIQDTLISDDTSDEELVFRDPPYTIPEYITTFGRNVIQITDSTYDGHKYLCKNYSCVNIPMPTTGYCKKCRDLSRTSIDISKSWNPKHPAFKIHKGHVKNYLQSKCPEIIDEVFELETKDKFKCARHVIKDIRSYNLERIRISDYPVSIDDEDIMPYLQRFFN